MMNQLIKVVSIALTAFISVIWLQVFLIDSVLTLRSGISVA